jgi:hypothetical protein
MEDIFSEEQKIFDDAQQYAGALKDGAAFDPAKYTLLAKEYGRMLKQLRRVTKLSDRAAGSLNESKHDLLDKAYY